MVLRTQHQELKIFTTTLRFISLYIAICSCAIANAQIFEASAKVSQGVVQLNNKPTSQRYQGEDGLDFYSEEVTSQSLPAFEFYGGMRMRDFPLIFGMSFTLNRFETQYKGNTLSQFDNSLGSFTLQKSGLLFAYAYRIGYRHNAFKTIRPFVFFDLGLMVSYNDRVEYMDLDHEGYSDGVDVSLYSSIELKRRMGLSIGLEWRSFAFSFDIHRMREELVYEDEGNEISYNKRRLFSLGVTYFFIRETFYKSQGTYVPDPSTGYTHSMNYTPRAPKYFSIIGGVGAHMYVGGAGMAKDVTEDVTFLNLKTSTSQLSGSTSKEETEITMLRFGYYSSENTGIPRFSLGLAFHNGPLELELMGNYHRFINIHEYEYTYDKVSRYVINGNPNPYFREGGYHEYSISDHYLENQMQATGAALALKYKFEQGDNGGFPIYLGAGWHQNYYSILSSTYKGVNSKALELSQDIANAFNAQDLTAEGESYYSFEDDSYYLSDEAFIDLVENQNGYESLQSYKDTRTSRWQKMTGLTLYVGLHYARFDVRAGFEWSWTDDFYLVRKINTGFISATYHLWGR